MDLRKRRWEGTDWIDLAQNRDQCRVLMSTVMNSINYLVKWGGVKSNSTHSALRQLIGILCQPRVIMMMKKLVE
jgi:hypothetical protein